MTHQGSVLREEDREAADSLLDAYLAHLGGGKIPTDRQVEAMAKALHERGYIRQNTADSPNNAPLDREALLEEMEVAMRSVLHDEAAAALAVLERHGWAPTGERGVDAEALWKDLVTRESFDYALARTGTVDVSGLRRELEVAHSLLEDERKSHRHVVEMLNAAEQEIDDLSEAADKAQEERDEARAQLAALRGPDLTEEEVQELAVGAYNAQNPGVGLELKNAYGLGNGWPRIVRFLASRLAVRAAVGSVRQLNETSVEFLAGQIYPMVKEAMGFDGDLRGVVRHILRAAGESQVRAEGASPNIDPDWPTKEAIERGVRAWYCTTGTEPVSIVTAALTAAGAPHVGSVGRERRDGFGPDDLTGDELKTLEMIYCDIISRDPGPGAAKVAVKRMLAHYETLRGCVTLEPAGEEGVGT